MKRTGRKKEWSVVLFGFALLLLFPPILSIYDSADLVLGVPRSYLILFVLWAVVILGTALGARRGYPDASVNDDTILPLEPPSPPSDEGET